MEVKCEVNGLLYVLELNVKIYFSRKPCSLCLYNYSITFSFQPLLAQGMSQSQQQQQQQQTAQGECVYYPQILGAWPWQCSEDIHSVASFYM